MCTTHSLASSADDAPAGQTHLVPHPDRRVDGHRRSGGGFDEALTGRGVHLPFINAQRVQRVGSDEPGGEPAEGLRVVEQVRPGDGAAGCCRSRPPAPPTGISSLVRAGTRMVVFIATPSVLTHIAHYGYSVF